MPTLRDASSIQSLLLSTKTPGEKLPNSQSRVSDSSRPNTSASDSASFKASMQRATLRADESQRRLERDRSEAAHDRSLRHEPSRAKSDHRADVDSNSASVAEPARRQQEKQRDNTIRDSANSADNVGSDSSQATTDDNLPTPITDDDANDARENCDVNNSATVAELNPTSATVVEDLSLQEFSLQDSDILLPLEELAVTDAVNITGDTVDSAHQQSLDSLQNSATATLDAESNIAWNLTAAETVAISGAENGLFSKREAGSYMGDALTAKGDALSSKGQALSPESLLRAQQLLAEQLRVQSSDTDLSAPSNGMRSSDLSTLLAGGVKTLPQSFGITSASLEASPSQPSLGEVLATGDVSKNTSGNSGLSPGQLAPGQLSPGQLSPGNALLSGMKFQLASIQNASSETVDKSSNTPLAANFTTTPTAAAAGSAVAGGLMYSAGGAVNTTMPSSLPAVPIHATFGDEKWANQVAERTALLVGQNIKSAELQLDPPELGPIQVRIHVSHEQAVVNFVSANPAVREALDQSLVRLRDMLQGQGMDLVDSGVSDHARQDRNSERNDSYNSPLVDDVEEPAAALRTVLQVNSNIDYFA